MVACTDRSPRLRDPRSGSRLFPSKMGLKTKTNRRRDKEVKGHKIIANIKKKPERYKKQKSCIIQRKISKKDTVLRTKKAETTHTKHKECVNCLCFCCISRDGSTSLQGTGFTISKDFSSVFVLLPVGSVTESMVKNLLTDSE